ncbi:excinuclease ABC subunit UvrC [Tolumonas lignilytica]|uniref:excinuclease ABC subunit UvrC n=1 Tax=Tolumonas lignilytica TaxID=1283284 RepID=UPI0004638F33|nr:excinuclease ABC subunit UvrC [Tolumonas lignilytica]
MLSEFDYRRFLKVVTEQPGVYRMLDNTGCIIYVGKAKNLKKRLSSYFRTNVDSAKTRALVSNIADIQVTVTLTETEALILEHNLIKQHRPKYNILLRDDKSYPYIFLSSHTHPRLSLHRGTRKLKGEYFGPYPSGYAVKESLHAIQKIFPIRQCEDSFYANRSRPCLLYQLKRCSGPCVPGLVSDEQYAEYVNLARMFLQGKDQQVITLLVDKMEKASNELRFEDAAKLRDQISNMRKIQEQQSVSGNIFDDLDIIGTAIRNGVASVHVLFIRQGKVLGSRNYFPSIPTDSDLSELLYAFVQQFYLADISGKQLPKEIILDHKLDDEDGLSDMLSQIAGVKVRITSRTRTERARYSQLATTNAETALTSKLAHKTTVEQRFRQLQEVLTLTSPIKRMECFDISHTQGEATVASCVVFDRDGPKNSDYRIFNIEGITPGDDYAAMKQALFRRFNKQQDQEKIPDILFIDGGLGQLKQAEAVISELAPLLQKQPLLIGIAKGESRKPGLETLIFGKTHAEIHLPADMPALHLIQHIRDESHRFAITGHRQRRNKKRTESLLETVPGIGAKRRQTLLKFMGGLQEVMKATPDELAKVPGISPALARVIYDTLH